MNDTEMLLLANKAWATQLKDERSDYFDRHVQEQKPNFLWIGCSDSRVAPDQITNSPPGVMSIHRNVANLVHADDRNLMAVLQVALEKTKVRHIILCGHYGCGGVAHGMHGDADGAVGDWVGAIGYVARAHADELEGLDEAQRFNRMVELNVCDQLRKLANLPIVRAAFDRGQPLELHGWVYDLRDGIIKRLLTMDGSSSAEAIEIPERVLV